jgi:hypothetical protein
MEEAKYKKNILYDSMYIKIKNRINKSMLLKVKTVSSIGGVCLVTKTKHRKVSGVLLISYILIWSAGYVDVCS